MGAEVAAEEGGTPAIVESIRAGLVFQLKEAVGVDVIEEHENDLLHRAMAAWQAEPTIEILGNPAAKRLSIVSFVIRAPSGRYLHHNFVVALLNDLFGIQTRGGCSCAGPYGHRLLGMDPDQSHKFEAEIAKGCDIGKLDPGTPTVTYCNKGVSGNAGQNILLRLGFGTVYNLSGGNNNYHSHRRSRGD